MDVASTSPSPRQSDSCSTGTTARSESRPARLPLSRRLLFAALPAVFVVGVLEVGARLIPVKNVRFAQMNDVVVYLGTGQDESLIEPDPELFWQLRPNLNVAPTASILWKGQLTNSQRLRNLEPLPPPSPDRIRIVCVGDSTTFGLGSTLADSWPALLEQQLNQGSAGGVFEVINAGVPGYTSHQGLRRLARHIATWQPDLVIATFGTNDCWHWNNQTDRDQGEQLASASRLHRWTSGLRSVELLSRWMQSRGREDQGTEWAGETVRNFFVEPRATWIPRVPLPEFHDNLQSLNELCRRNGCQLMLVEWPDLQLLRGAVSVRLPYLAAIRKFRDTEDVPGCDLLTVFQRHGSESANLFLPNDIVHVTPAGNRLVSSAIRSAVERILPVSRLLSN